MFPQVVQDVGLLGFVDENTSQFRRSHRNVNDQPVHHNNESLDQFPRENGHEGTDTGSSSSSQSSSLLSARARRSPSSEFDDPTKEHVVQSRVQLLDSDQDEMRDSVYRELFRNSTWVMAVVMYFINSLNYIGFETLCVVDHVRRCIVRAGCFISRRNNVISMSSTVFLLGRQVC